VSERNERETRPDMIFLSPSEKMYFDLILTRRQRDEAIALLRELVEQCTPPRLQTDDQFFGVRMPTKDVVERARSGLARLLQEAK